MVDLKPCPYRVHGEKVSSLVTAGEYFYNETFMPCMRDGCPCYHEDLGQAWCDRNGTLMKLNKS